MTTRTCYSENIREADCEAKKIRFELLGFKNITFERVGNTPYFDLIADTKEVQ